MEQLVYPNPAPYRDILIRFSALNHTNYSEVGIFLELLKHEKFYFLRFGSLFFTILDYKESLLTVPWGEVLVFSLLGLSSPLVCCDRC